jgi:fucose 4-O-acetylase-like acetyltransferase
MADETPPSRNRYVDLLRAVSIVAVVVGHWLIAAPVVRDGRILGVNLLAAEPWSQWLTWVFQVMPIFFLVGGFGNAGSWRAHRTRGGRYGGWLGARLQRLVLPAVPLVVVWSTFALVARSAGMEGSLLRLGSQVALIPLWFLAVYVLVVALTPVTLTLWDRNGMASVAGLAAAALLVDVARFHTTELVGWLNFLFVWAALHQLGFAWRDGRMGGTRRSLAVGGAGLVVLAALIWVGPYPVSMVGVPGAEASNNSPPTLALVALGVAQMGFALAFEGRATRWLARTRPWAATIAVNGSIMTIYLWHLTAMVAVVGIGLAVGGIGLATAPATAAWWVGRPLWMAALTIATLPFLARFTRYERRPTGEPLRAAVSLTAAAAACVGFAAIAGGGIADADSWLRPAAVAPVLAAGVLLIRRRATPGGRPTS